MKIGYLRQYIDYKGGWLVQAHTTINGERFHSGVYQSWTFDNLKETLDRASGALIHSLKFRKILHE